MKKYKVELHSGSIYYVEGFMKQAIGIEPREIWDNEYFTGELIGYIPTEAFIKKVSSERVDRDTVREVTNTIPSCVVSQKKLIYKLQESISMAIPNETRYIITSYNKSVDNFNRLIEEHGVDMKKMTHIPIYSPSYFGKVDFI